MPPTSDLTFPCLPRILPFTNRSTTPPSYLSQTTTPEKYSLCQWFPIWGNLAPQATFENAETFLVVTSEGNGAAGV